MPKITAHISNGDGTCNKTMERRAMKLINGTTPKDVIYTDYEKAAHRVMEAIQADNGIGYVEPLRYPPEHVIEIAGALEHLSKENQDMIFKDEILIELAIGMYIDGDNQIKCDEYPELAELNGLEVLDEALNNFFEEV